MKQALCYTLIFFFVSTLGFSQTRIFVALDGDDVTGTGKKSAPFRTVEHAAEIANQLNEAVKILVRGGVYHNPNFSPTLEDKWKDDTNEGTVVKLYQIHGAPNAWITIQPFQNEKVVFEGDGYVNFNIRDCSYLKVSGFEIRGMAASIPLDTAWAYWGKYKYFENGNWVYGDRAEDIKTVHNITEIQPNITYEGLPDLRDKSVMRPNLFNGKGLLVNLSHHIVIEKCNIHHIPSAGVNVAKSDFVEVTGCEIHHNSSRGLNGTHGLIIDGLENASNDNRYKEKLLFANNLVYSNYNELYSWVQSKVECTTTIDEGKGICLLRTRNGKDGFNGYITVVNNITFDNGKSGIHMNDVDDAHIINNTVYMNARTNVTDPVWSGGSNAGISLQRSNNILVYNNLIVVPNGLDPEVKALSEGQNCNNWKVKNNLVWGGKTSDFEGGYTVGDPNMFDPENGNFRPRSSSPAVDAGTTFRAPTRDFKGNLRDATPDIGAIEYIANNAVVLNNNEMTEVVSIANANIYPNPTSGIVHVKEVNTAIQVFDITGKNISSEVQSAPSGNSTLLNLTQVPAGIYFIKANNTTSQIVKQ